ncbi:MAG: hypothetical protein NTY12_02785 [Candidatus Falkowbacteria bacterium]|nr:hypothetical protein [Candidatus Falkowbacteria bacterium]
MTDELNVNPVSMNDGDEENDETLGEEEENTDADLVADEEDEADEEDAEEAI